MAFMIPFYTCEPFCYVSDHGRDGEWVPEETVTANALCDDDPDECLTVLETVTGKWFARLSAPGYLDCTEWQGPYETREEAARAIESDYDVCPCCGTGLSDEGNGTADEIGCDCAGHKIGDVDHGC